MKKKTKKKQKQTRTKYIFWLKSQNAFEKK